MNDAFYYLFADKDDVYFSKGFIGNDFQRYLYQLLIDSGFESVFYYKKSANKAYVDVCFESKKDAELYIEIGQKKSWFLNDKTQILEDISEKIMKCPKNDSEKNKKIRYYIRQEDATVRDYIRRLITSKESDHYAFVFSMEIFSRLYKEYGSANTLAGNIIHDLDGSIFIIHEDPDSKGKLPPLPEIAFDRDAQNLANEGKGLLYDRLSEINDIQVMKWDAFEERQIRRLMTRIYLENKTLDEESYKSVSRFMCDLLIREEGIEELDLRIKNKIELYRIISRRDGLRKLQRHVNNLEM